VVRHHLVQRIVRAYDEYKARLAEQQLSLLEGKAGTETKAANGKNGAAQGSAAPPLEEPRVRD
jgi:hypothetical protein